MDEHDGCAFISLEFIEGGTLAERIGGKPQDPVWAARLVEKLARAMDVAHQNKIVHRDLKPGNILLTRDGTPKIADFGLARLLDSNDRHTRTGVIVGTLAYMAPEIAGGNAKGAEPSADIYALGAILYELLTGRPPFRADTAQQMICEILQSDPPRPRVLNPSIPRDLETICLGALARHPSDRYPSARDLADDLERFVSKRPVQRQSPGVIGRAWRWGQRNPMMATLGGLAILLLVILVGSTIWSHEPPDESVKKVANRAVLRIATDPNYPPMELKNGHDFEGFDIDLCRELANHLGVTAHFIEVDWNWDELVRRLNADEFDLIASTVTIDEERETQVGFVEHLQMPLVFLCNQKTNVRNVKDLNGKRVGAQKDTPAAKQLNAILPNGTTLVKIEEGTPATFRLLLSGQVDVLLVDKPVAQYYMKTYQNLKIGGDVNHPLDQPRIGFAFAKGDLELQKAVAERIRLLKRDGRWNTFLDNWFNN